MCDFRYEDDPDYSLNLSDSGTDSNDDTESDCELPPMLVESSTEDNELLPKGRRIVGIGHVMKQLELVTGHSKHCTMEKYKYIREIKNELLCSWIYYCDNCENEFAVTSEPADRKMEVNDAVVWGAMAVGVGFS